MRLAKTLIVACFVILAGTAPAVASPHVQGEIPDAPGREITRWDATYALNPDGSVEVFVEFDFDFGNDPGHGPYLTLVTKQGYDASHNRVYRVSDVQANSTTGAPHEVDVQQRDSYVEIKIGNKYIANVSGVQTYQLSYTVDAVMNSTAIGSQGPAHDEFYWNAVGTLWTIPLSHVSATVIAPVPAERYTCFAGPNRAATPCDAVTADATSVSFTQGHLAPGEPLSLVVAYPSGTFDTQPSLERARSLANSFALTPLTGLGATAIAGAGALVIYRRLRTTAMDDEYVGLTPGLTPVGPSDAGAGVAQAAAGAWRIGKARKSIPVAVQFEPPRGMRPGQIGTLIDEKADARDVTATMVDLAVRGYLRIDEAGEIATPGAKPRADYLLVKLKEPDEALVAYETALLKALFLGGDEVKMSNLATTFATTMSAVQAAMYDNVTELGWFRANPSKARWAWFGWGALVTLVGVAGTILLGLFTGMALLAVPLVVLGVIVMATTMNAPARTAQGTAVVRQARGFELYLTTAEARQIRFEEGRDIFSEYLPYAIAFGVAKKWSELFEQLAREGVTMPEPTWYHGVALGAFWHNSAGLGDRMSGFATVATTSLSAPTPGSSGGSGFSSGGGFAGGGGGGGGGGGW